MACSKACKEIGTATINSTFIVGCQTCPPFPANARKQNSTVQLLRKKFQKLGISVSR